MRFENCGGLQRLNKSVHVLSSSEDLSNPQGHCRWDFPMLCPFLYSFALKMVELAQDVFRFQEKLEDAMLVQQNELAV